MPGRSVLLRASLSSSTVLELRKSKGIPPCSSFWFTEMNGVIASYFALSTFPLQYIKFDDFWSIIITIQRGKQPEDNCLQFNLLCQTVASPI
uniref:Uncharacterized protein n=1 Tax=Cucumis melo TaxID=3656 RepID=A0A9I9EEZ8_CUCME